MFLSQFPCEHQRHGQQTHYLQQMQRDCVWYFFLQTSRFSSLLTSSPQPCTPSRQRGGSRRESTGTHTQNWGRSFLLLLILFSRRKIKAHGWKLSCSSSCSVGTMITLGFIHHTGRGGGEVTKKKKKNLPWRQNPQKLCNSSRNES